MILEWIKNIIMAYKALKKDYSFYSIIKNILLPPLEINSSENLKDFINDIKKIFNEYHHVENNNKEFKSGDIITLDLLFPMDNNFKPIDMTDPITFYASALLKSADDKIRKKEHPLTINLN